MFDMNLSAVPSTRINGFPVEKSPDVMKCRAHSIGGDWKSNVQQSVAPVSPVVARPPTPITQGRKIFRLADSCENHQRITSLI
jgi:hypothetical protein